MPDTSQASDLPHRREHALGSARATLGPWAGRLLALVLGILAAPAARAAGTDFCVDRPGNDTPACTLAPGRLMIEVSAIDRTSYRDAGERSETTAIGDVLARVGLGGDTEAQLGFTAYGLLRERDTPSEEPVDRSGTGDLHLGMRHGLTGSDGPAAVQAFVTLSTGSSAIGAGTWTAGFLLPLELDLSDEVSFAATPEVDAAADESGDGRHLAYGGSTSLSVALDPALSVSGEVTAFRDDDPSGASSTVSASQSIAWRAASDLQVDAQLSEGLNGSTPDLQLILGFARLF